MGDSDSASGGALVVGLGMGGERIATLSVEDPQATKFEAVEKSLAEAVGKASTADKVKFVLGDGTLLTEEHQEQTVEEVLGPISISEVAASSSSCCQVGCLDVSGT